MSPDATPHIHHHTGAAASVPQSGPCEAALNCRKAPETWAVAAGTLNALWSDIFPRLVVAYWKERAAPAAGMPWMIGWQPNELINVLEAVAASSVPGGVAPANALKLPANGVWGTKTFEDRVQTLLAHVQGVNPIPIQIMGEGEFDFILSDQGLDLFVPNEPADLRDLIRYYTFRGTGRRSVGIPFYIGASGPAAAKLPNAKSSAMTGDSPTGPSQILMSRAAVQAKIVSVLVQNADLYPCVQEVLHCLNTKSARGAQTVRVTGDPLGAEYDTLSGRLAEIVLRGEPLPPDDLVRMREIQRLRRPSVAGAPHHLTSTVTPRETDAVTMTAEQYACLMEPLRCWQVSGAVYRAILTELPRVVATVWLEQVDGVAGVASYTNHFGLAPQGNPDSGIRKIFRERLETSLPDSHHMDFQTYGAERVGWDDVMITNRGFHFPEIKALAIQDANATTATWHGMYDEIMKGRAGNPVFTDSIYCL